MPPVTITRQFSLVPLDLKGEPISGVAKKPIYKHFTDALVKVRDLKNTFIKQLILTIRDEGIHRFQDSGKTAAKRLYDKGQFRAIQSPIFRTWKLKERVKRPVFYEVYDILRNWIVRNEWLKMLSKELVKLFKENPFIQDKFLRGKRYFYTELKDLLTTLKNNRFGVISNGNNKGLSIHELNKYIFQLRNIFLSKYDFSSCLLFMPSINLHPFQEYIRSLFLNLSLTEEIYKKVARGFFRKVNKKNEPIPESELNVYWLTQFFRKISIITTKKINKLYSNLERIQAFEQKQVIMNKQQAQLETLQTENKRIIKFVEGHLGVYAFNSVKEFKKKRNNVLSLQKQAILDDIANISLYKFIRKAFAEELASYGNNSNHFVLRKIFQPPRLSYRISEISTSSFIEYFKIQLRNKIREFLKEQFFTETFVSSLYGELVSIGKNIYSYVKTPKCKNLSLSQTAKDEKIFISKLLGDNITDLDYTHLTANIGFQAHKFISVRILDKKKLPIGEEKVISSRIKQLVNMRFIPMNPTLTLKHRKLIVHLPFEQKKGDGSKLPSHTSLKKEHEMGIDLGLLHFGVISIQNKLIKQELEHYFLGTKEIFELQFDETKAKWTPQKRVKSVEKLQPFSITRRIKNLRNEIRLVQRKIHETQNHIEAVYHEFREDVSKMDISQASSILFKENHKYKNYTFNNKEMRKLKLTLFRIQTNPELKEEILERFIPNYRHKQEINRLKNVLTLLWNKLKKYNQ